MRKTFETYIANNRRYLLIFLAVWCVLLLVGLRYTRAEAHLILNSVHNPLLDLIFKNITHIGGSFPIIFGFVLLLWNVRKGLFILFGQLCCALITVPLKTFFAHQRPSIFFIYNLRIDLPAVVEGVLLRTENNSFPSGHTSAVFALATCLAAITPPKYRQWQIVWLVIGWLVAYSRIYLSQHFVDDILFGSVIGVFSGLIVYLLCYRKEWGEYPLIRIRKH